MILFEEDWNEYPDAILQENTKNKSFLKYAITLRDMGINNYKWPLALINPDLLNVDPFDPNITRDQAMAVIEECRLNPWYYFRECIVLDVIAGEKQYYIASRGNMALYWLFFCHIDIILVQIRQTGKTFGCSWLARYLMNVACTDTKINLLTKDDKLRSKTLEEIISTENQTPFYLRLRKKDDLANPEEFTIKSLGNKYVGHLPSQSEKGALNVGRGLTSPIFFIDELAYLYNNRIMLAAALPATTAARAKQIAKGEPYGVVMTTTAGKLDDRDGEFAYELIDSSAQWNEKLMDATGYTNLEDLVRKASPGRVATVHCMFNHRQLGYSDTWLASTIERARSTGEDMLRDFYNKWTSGTQSHPLDTNILEVIRKSEVLHPPYSQIFKSRAYIVAWNQTEAETVKYFSEDVVLGLDPSQASGGDDMGMVFMHVKTGRVLATVRVNEDNVIMFCQWLVELLEVFNKLKLIPENRSTGSAIIDYLLMVLPTKGIDPFRVIYNRIMSEPDEFPDKFKEATRSLRHRDPEIYIKCKKYFGFVTSASGIYSRSELYGTVLQSAAKNVGHLVCSQDLIKQISTLTSKNNRVNHSSGGHDDLCFVGSTLVRTIDGNRPISELKLGDLVLTRQGYKPIVHLFSSEKEVITKFGLTGTANHPFITPIGEVEFKDLTPESKVYVWNEKLSCIEEKRIIDTLSRNGLSIETISTDMVREIPHQLPSTDKSMRTITDQSLKEWISITETTTSVITRRKISSVLQKRSIVENIQCLRKKEKNEVLKARRIINLQNGKKKTLSLRPSTGLKMERRAKGYLSGRKKIQNLPVKYIQTPGKRALVTPAHLPSGVKKTQSLQSRYMKLLEKKQKPRLERNMLEKVCRNGEKKTQNSQNRSMLKPVEKVLQLEGRKERVYNLMVADCHEYFVNDILVHNCIAWLLCFWWITRTRNLSNYDINVRDILSTNKVVQSEESIAERSYRYMQNKAKQQLELLTKQMRGERDTNVLYVLERQMRTIASVITEESGEVFAIDDYISQIKEQQKMSRDYGRNSYMNHIRR